MYSYRLFIISLILKFIALFVFLSYNSTALGKGIEIRYYERDRDGANIIFHSAGKVIYSGRRIEPINGTNILDGIVNDLTSYYWLNPSSNTYSDLVRPEAAAIFSKVTTVFKVCVVDTTAGRWSVYGTGEEIGSGLEPKPPNGIIELTKGIIKTSSPSTSIEDLQASSITSPAPTPILLVSISPSTHTVLEALSQEKTNAVAALEHSEIEMLKGGLSEAEAQELISRGKASSDVAVLRNLSTEETKAITELQSAVACAAKETSQTGSSSLSLYISTITDTSANGGGSSRLPDQLAEIIEAKTIADSTSANLYIVKVDPTDDNYVKTLSKSQQQELYRQTLEDIGNSMIIAASGNGGDGSPLDPLEEIIEQKPADFKENKFEIYDELMLIATDPTNSRISELITPLHVTSSYTGISAGENSIKAKQKSAWVRGLYGFINQGQELEQMGFKGHNYGGTVGVDANITDDNLIGISYTRMVANFKYKIGAGNKANTISDVFALYGVSEVTNDFILQGLASVGKIQVKQHTQRKIGDNKFKTVYSNFNVDVYSAEAILNYQVPNLQKYYIMPNIGMRFSKSYDEGYDETNAGVFNMKTSPRSYTSWLLLTGLKAGINCNLSENFSLIPGVHIQLGKYINNKANSHQVVRVLDTVTANVPVKSRGTAYNIGSTLRIDYKNRVEILFSYNAHLIGKYRSHQGSLSFKCFF